MQEFKTCKYCLEEIKFEASVCKHCGKNQLSNIENIQGVIKENLIEVKSLLKNNKEKLNNISKKQVVDFMKNFKNPIVIIIYVFLIIFIIYLSLITIELLTKSYYTYFTEPKLKREAVESRCKYYLTYLNNNHIDLISLIMWLKDKKEMRLSGSNPGREVLPTPLDFMNKMTEERASKYSMSVDQFIKLNNALGLSWASGSLTVKEMIQIDEIYQCLDKFSSN
jgi:hypothetical protein